MNKRTEWRMYVCSTKTMIIFVHVDDIKMAGKRQNMCHMWKKCMKLVDLGEPASFLDHVYLGYTQRECKSNGGITKLCWPTQKFLGCEKSHAKTVAWSYDMERSCDKMRGGRYCE